MWWTEAEWAALTDAKRCGMCADAGQTENLHSLLVVETPTTWVRLARNHRLPGPVER